MSTQNFIWVRHGTIANVEYLCGRTDIGLAPMEDKSICHLREALRKIENPRIISSPAQRCVQTCAAVFPDNAPLIHSEFWEQNFGDHDGMKHQDLPTLSPMNRQEIAQYLPPNGESYSHVVKRVRKGLDALEKVPNTIIFAHAGVIRAALSIALEYRDAGLAFSVDNLSITKTTRYDESQWGIAFVNRANL